MSHYYDQILNTLWEILTAYTALHRLVFKSISVYEYMHLVKMCALQG